MSLRPRDTTKCRRCQRQYAEHEQRSCPDGSGRVFDSQRRLLGASNSFTEVEVMLLERILKGLPMREDLRVIARSGEFGSLVRKVQAMVRTAAANRAAHDAADDEDEAC